MLFHRGKLVSETVEKFWFLFLPLFFIYTYGVYFLLDFFNLASSTSLSTTSASTIAIYVSLALLLSAISYPVLLYLFFGPRSRGFKHWGQKHVFITGGSEGTGFELAKLLVQKRQAKIVTLFSRSQTKLDAAKKQLEEIVEKQKKTTTRNTSLIQGSTSIRTIAGDTTSLDSLRKAVEEDSTTPAPDVLIAAAGMAIPKYFEDASPEDFERQMRVNYLGVVNSAKAFLEHMPGAVTEAGKGSDYADERHKNFVAVSSLAAAVPFIGYASYAPTKAAVRTFCDVLRNEFVDSKTTSIHICFPPDMDTPGFHEEQKTKPIECKKVFPECFNELFQPGDVAEMILAGIEHDRYHIFSPDLVGNFLASRGWGPHPRQFVFLEFVLSPLFVLIHEAIVFLMDRCVVKYDHHGAWGGGGAGGNRERSPEKKRA
ncbi:unnamed protein product [Amoebophrya sp. A120]|nr:unnamed protein product [Amoebophrya sp. A120]|eukprot:GSA120T00018183001.1